MNGFSFPPPPPPPPQQNSRGGFNDRGSRGRGRGNNRGGFHREGFQQQHGSFGPRHNSNPLNGFSNCGRNGWQPTPSYQNTSGMLNGQSAVNNGFANHASLFPNAQHGAGFQQPIVPNPHPHSGFKRTHNQAFNSNNEKAGQTKTESKPKTPAPPPVPCFGFALSPAPAENSASTNEPVSVEKKQRKHNSLGLTPKGEVHEDSDNDVDEEEAFAQSGQNVMIQHGGRSIQLNTAADVAAWIAERKKYFPTQARTATRKAAQEATREKAQAAREAGKKRRLEERDKAIHAKKQEKNKRRKEKPKAVKSEEPELQTTVETEVAPDDPLARIAQLEEQLRQAREALLKVPKPEAAQEGKTEPQEIEPVVRIKEDPEPTTNDELPLLPATAVKDEQTSSIPQNLGLAYGSDHDDEAGTIYEASSEEPSSVSSDSSAGSDSDSDAPPEEESSKSRGPVSVPPPPARERPNKSQPCYSFANTGKCKYGNKCMRSHDVPCRFYAKNGHCRYGSKCRMSHDVTPGTGKSAATTNAELPKTMSLRERMIEKELKEEAMLGLQVIKQLGASGFFEER